MTIVRLDRKSKTEKDTRTKLLELSSSSPVPKDEYLEHFFSYLPKKEISHMLFFYEMYKKILDVHGSIFDFGCRWGRNLSYLITLRGILEPYNYTRKVIGFDSFKGYVGIDNKKDGNHKSIKSGSYAVSNNYLKHLEEMLSTKEAELPISHLKKYEIVKGDVTKTFSNYLDKHPEQMVAFAFFDLNLYKPTKVVFDKVLKKTNKGSLIIFDELNHESIPGETIAFKEVLDKNNIKVKLLRSPISASKSYFIVE